MPASFTRSFENISAADLPLVGGKGANLGEMVQAGFPIPPGFCLTTHAFRKFISQSGYEDELYRKLASLAVDDVETVRRVGAEIRAKLGDAPIPREIESELKAAWKKSGEEVAYAVRSSATAEDLPTASFAGQQDTFLNVVGEEALIGAVRNCWISLFTNRAILYRTKNGFDHRKVSLSVVVQRMVEPAVSGILFTADPATGHRRVLTIDASYGLGEALVAGLVSADLYRVDKRSMQVISTQIGEKKIAIRSMPGGGTQREELSEELQNTQVLDERQIVEIARIGRDLEAHYAAPQDIEWVLSEGNFFVVQSRPITSLYPIPEPPSPDDNLRVYFSISHIQVMTDAFSPMGISFIRTMIPFGIPDGDTFYRPGICYAGGRLYADLSPMLYHPMMRRILLRMLTIADDLAKKAMAVVVERPEFIQAAGHATDKVKLHHVFRNVFPLVRQAMLKVWIHPPEGAVERVLDNNRISLHKVEADLFSQPAGVARLKHMQSVISEMFVDHAVPMVPYIAAAMISKTLLEHLAGGNGDPQDIQAVYRGLQGNVTTEMDMQVGDLADIARKHPQVQDILVNHPAEKALEGMRAVPGGEEFLQALEGFMQRYGARGPSEIDISRLRWSEDPTPLLQVIVGNLAAGQSGVHRRHHRELVEAGEAAVERLADAVRSGIFGSLRAAIVRRMGRVTRQMFAIREHPKYLIVRVMWMVKQIIQDAAAQLVRERRLERAEDVWLLQIHELIDALEHPEKPLDALIAERRREQTYFQGLIPPRVITSDGEIVTAKISRENLPESALAGSPVSGGTVEGIAHVILDPSAQVLQPGEILVAPFTDPGWTPLFINAAGLVMEVGGLMTHGSVVAREYGLPAVVGVPEATRQIKTGQRIRVDGDAGIVEFLDGSVEGGSHEALDDHS